MVLTRTWPPSAASPCVTVEQAQEPSVIKVTRSIQPDSRPGGRRRGDGDNRYQRRLRHWVSGGKTAGGLHLRSQGSVTPSDITDITEDAGREYCDLFTASVSHLSATEVDTSSSSGQHPFPSGSQLTYGVDKDTAPVVGESSVRVEQAQEPSVIKVTRSIQPDSRPGGRRRSDGDNRYHRRLRHWVSGGKAAGGLHLRSQGSVTPSDITDITEDAGREYCDLFTASVSHLSATEVDTSISSGQHPFPSGSQLTYGVDKDTAPVVGESSVTVEQAQESSVIKVNRTINTRLASRRAAAW